MDYEFLEILIAIYKYDKNILTLLNFEDLCVEHML